MSNRKFIQKAWPLGFTNGQETQMLVALLYERSFVLYVWCHSTLYVVWFFGCNHIGTVNLGLDLFSELRTVISHDSQGNRGSTIGYGQPQHGFSSDYAVWFRCGRGSMFWPWRAAPFVSRYRGSQRWRSGHNERFWDGGRHKKSFSDCIAAWELSMDFWNSHPSGFGLITLFSQKADSLSALFRTSLPVF